MDAQIREVPVGRILGNPVILSMPTFQGARSMGAGATRTMFGPDELGGPRFVADFPNLQNHKTLGKTGAGSLSITAGAVRCVPSDTLPGRSPSTVTCNCCSRR